MSLCTAPVQPLPVKMTLSFSEVFTALRTINLDTQEMCSSVTITKSARVLYKVFDFLVLEGKECDLVRAGGGGGAGAFCYLI